MIPLEKILTILLVLSLIILISLSPSYRVQEILLNSPAYKAGVRRGDVLYKINGKEVYNYKLQDIVEIFQKKPQMKIKLVVIRNNQFLNVEFRLEKLI